ncbi:hypothetical protein B7494_g57 [Chlorociboria aeruginascens]|nr:hypothetical protein B7494_g57 [Chlorociboria aeruginascens]
MQSLARIIPRSSISSNIYGAASRSLKSSSRSSIRPTICLQCRIRSQAIRHFAESSKPPSADSPSQSPKDLAPEKLEDANPPPPTTELPSAEENRRLVLTKRFSHLMDHLQGNIFVASQRINDLTGYSGIEALKSRIVNLEERVQSAQEAVRSSRLTYKTTVADRAATQREVTTLLARKDSWTPVDLERFTSLYRNDHSNEQAVQEAATRLADAEKEAETAAAKLSSSILSRYHEEQIWSDKIRRMSTWGTWGLMGVNVLLFLVFQFGFEPWRRRRLVNGFEEKVKEALELEKAKRGGKSGTGVEGEEVSLDKVVETGVLELQNEMDDDVRNPDPAVDAVVACIEGDEGGDASSEKRPLEVPVAPMKLIRRMTWKVVAQDLFSERLVSMRKQDVTILALESAATGAALVGLIATLILRYS